MDRLRQALDYPVWHGVVTTGWSKDEFDAFYERRRAERAAARVVVEGERVWYCLQRPNNIWFSPEPVCLDVYGVEGPPHEGCGWRLIVDVPE